MRVTILGSGVCASHFSSTDVLRLPPAFLVEVGGGSILFDCSESIRLRLEQAGVDYSSVKYVAISHSHPDHCAIFHFIQSQFCKGLWGGEKFRNETLRVFCPRQMVEEFDSAWNFYFPDWRNNRYPFPKVELTAMGVKDATTVPLPFGNLVASKVYHGRNDAVDALGFRLETSDGVFAYSGDTRDCREVRELAKNADIFICESTAPVGNEEAARVQGHLTPYQASMVCKDAGVKKVVIVHYPGTDSDEALRTDFARGGFNGELVIGKDFQQHSV